MNSEDTRSIEAVTEALTALLGGERPRRVSLPQDMGGEEARKLCETVNRLVAAHEEAEDFLVALAKGILYVDPPWHNHLISPFKELQANLRHLVWQTQQVARGDLNQHVAFMGDFSIAFNSMIDSLREKQRVERALKESEQGLELALEGADLGLWDLNPGTGELNINSRWAAILGYSVEQLRPHMNTWLDLIHPDDKGPFIDAWYRHLNGETPNFRFEHRLRAQSGSWKWILSLGRLVERSTDGKPLRIAGTNLDISDRKLAEERMRDANEMLQLLLATAATGIFIVDGEHTVSTINDAFSSITGYTRQDVVGKPCTSFCAPPCENMCALSELNPHEQMLRLQCTIRSKDGRILTVLKNVTPIVDEDGYLSGGVESFVDVTELIEARNAAEHAGRAKMEFLAKMSHEIRTPINGIMGLTELALNTDLTPQQRNYLQSVDESAEVLLRLINDILDFSKIEMGKLKLVQTDFSLREWISDTLVPLSLQAGDKGLELLYTVSPDVPDALVGDEGRLRQLLVNLVGNAIKFTEKGEIIVTVNREPGNTDQVCLSFSVSDTGIGISAKNQEKIFGAFEQVDGSTTRRYDGTGLGLAICTQLVRMMGGQLKVESVLGVGSTFRFTVCLGCRIEPGMGTEALNNAAMEGVRVLVVDDNETSRTFLQDVLMHWGMKPVTVANGTDALTSLREAYGDERPFGIVIVDAGMPGMHGCELVRRINVLPELKETRVIMLTSAAAYDDELRLRELRLAASLPKPVKLSKLFETISRTLMESTASPSISSQAMRPTLRKSDRSLKILLVEDNPINRNVAASMLKKIGHQVSVAVSGVEALSESQKATYDLILMDVEMPEMDGVEATRAIRERERRTGEHIPIIALTAYAMDGDRDRFLEAGMDGYISKPVKLKNISDTIERVMWGTKEQESEI